MEDGFEFAGLSTLNQKMLFRLYSLVDTHFFWIPIKGIVRLVHELIQRMDVGRNGFMRSFFMTKPIQSDLDMVVNIRPSGRPRYCVEVFIAGLHEKGSIKILRLCNDGNRTVAEQLTSLIAGGTNPLWAIVTVQNEVADLVTELFDLRNTDALHQAIDDWHRTLINIPATMKVGWQNQASA